MALRKGENIMDYRELIRRGYSWNGNHFRQELNEPRSLIAEMCFAIETLLEERDAALKEPEEALTAKEMAEVACALNLLKEYQFVGSVEHFRELSQAENDGRLVVKPSTPAFLTREEVKAALKKKEADDETV